MLGKKLNESKMVYNFTLEEHIPEDSIYRLLDKFLDLRFLYKECKSLYGKTGKPSIDPVVFIKFQIYGYLENIISDRELVRKASDSLSARYFLCYDIDESLPWHSTISRTRSLYGKELFEKIFNKVLELCYQSGLIEGKHQTIDSTLVKANASLDNMEKKAPQLTTAEYIEKTFEENEDKKEKKDKQTNNDNDPSGSNKINKKTTDSSRKNDLSESKTDPDSRIASKPGKPSDLYYKAQYCADTKGRVITDVLVTYADIIDKHSLLEVIERAAARLGNFDLVIEMISADRGYSLGANLREFEERGITAYIPAQRTANSKGDIHKDEFTFNKEENVFICPNQKVLKYYTYDKQKECNRYKADKKDCADCPLKEQCCPEGNCRSVSQTIYYEEFERLSERLKTPEGRRASVLRRVISEGLFAEAKNSHGLRKFMTRGMESAQKNSYMIATVQNLKRLIGNYRKNKLVIRKILENNFRFLFSPHKNLFFSHSF